MNQVLGSAVHVHVTIVLDWKMAAVIGSSILIRLLLR